MDLRSRNARVLAGAAAAQTAVSFLTFGLPSIGPEIQDALDISLPQLGALLSATLFGSGLTLIAAGAFLDRVGTRAGVAAGTTLGAAALAAAALVDSFWPLLALLVLSGVGTSTVPVGGAGALFRTFRPARRGLALGIRQTAVPVGGIVGAIVIPLLEHAGGLSLVLAVAAVGVGATGLAFVRVAPPGSGGPRQGLALRRVWESPGMRRLLGVAALYIVTLQASLVYVVPAARDAGLTAFAAGAVYLLLNVAAAASRIVWGQVADRGGGTRRVRSLVETGVVAAAGAALFGAALHAGAAAVAAATVVLAIGAFGWNGLLYVVAGERVPTEIAGQSVALALTVVFVVSSLCTPPLGALVDAAGWNALWATTAGFALAGAALARGLSRREPSARA